MPKDKDWREFEKLVARRERHLGPVGACVKSPDRVRDKTTRRLRQVDASIRQDVGSTSILITIECRRRRRKPDVRWIEELATKQVAIGAAKTIAVSSTPLSDPALQKAHHCGIDVRIASEVEPAEIMTYLSGIELTSGRLSVASATVTFHFRDARFVRDDELEPTVKLARGMIIYAPILFTAPDAAAPSVSLLDAMLQQTGLAGPPVVDSYVDFTVPPGESADLTPNPALVALFLPLPEDSTPVVRQRRLVFDDGEAYILTTRGLLALMTADVTMTVVIDRQPVPFSRGLRYKDPAGKTIAYGEAEARFQMAGGGEGTLILGHSRILPETDEDK